MTQPPTEPVNLLDYEALARERLDPMAYGYFAGGAGDEITLRENRAAFERLQLLPRVLVDVGQRDISTTVLGRSISLPVLIAPTAFHRLACPEGEVATARAAAEVSTIMVLSTLSNTPLEEVAGAAAGPRWFQLYIFKDRGLTRALVEQAAAAGYEAICITVDAPLLGRRERDIRNRFSLPPELTIASATDYLADLRPTDAPQSALSAFFVDLLDQSVTWDDVAWLQGLTSLPVVLKGIHHPEDARLAVENGVSAVVVSNHGARQLDTAPATIDMLPAIADEVQGRAELLMDGGVRRGTDVLKALALGARAVLIGRPVLWGLAVGGEEGVVRVLRLLAGEIDLAVALCGLTSVTDVPRGLVRRSG